MYYNEIYNNMYAEDYTFGAKTAFVHSLPFCINRFLVPPSTEFFASGPRDLARL